MNSYIIFFVFFLVIIIIIVLSFFIISGNNPQPPPPTNNSVTGKFSINNTKLLLLQNVTALEISKNDCVTTSNGGFNFLVPGSYKIQIFFAIKKQNSYGCKFRCYMFFQTISDKNEQLTVQNVNLKTKGPLFLDYDQIGWNDYTNSSPYIEENQSLDSTNCPLIFFVYPLKTPNNGIVYPNYSSLSITINVTQQITYFLQTAVDPQDDSNRFPGNTMIGNGYFYLNYLG